jgi:hypothetical protein
MQPPQHRAMRQKRNPSLDSVSRGSSSRTSTFSDSLIAGRSPTWLPHCSRHTSAKGIPCVTPHSTPSSPVDDLQPVSLPSRFCLSCRKTSSRGPSRAELSVAIAHYCDSVRPPRSRFAASDYLTDRTFASLCLMIFALAARDHGDDSRTWAPSMSLDPYGPVTFDRWSAGWHVGPLSASVSRPDMLPGADEHRSLLSQPAVLSPGHSAGPPPNEACRPLGSAAQRGAYLFQRFNILSLSLTQLFYQLSAEFLSCSANPLVTWTLVGEGLIFAQVRSICAIAVLLARWSSWLTAVIDDAGCRRLALTGAARHCRPIRQRRRRSDGHSGCESSCIKAFHPVADPMLT